jgi:hypothetical protein
MHGMLREYASAFTKHSAAKILLSVWIASVIGLGGALVIGGCEVLTRAKTDLQGR